jgi:hypothetical protein
MTLCVPQHAGKEPEGKGAKPPLPTPTPDPLTHPLPIDGERPAMLKP